MRKQLRWTSCLAVVAGLVAAGGADAVGGTVTDQAVSLTYAADHWSNFATADLVGVDASGDPLFATGFWYRAEGDTREYPLPPPDVELFSGGTIFAQWNNLDGKGFLVQETTQVLDGERPSGGFISVFWVLNNNPSPQTFDLFHYVDVDLAGTNGGDTGTLVAPGFLEFTDGASTVAYRTAGASHYEARGFDSLRALLNNDESNDLNDSGLPFGPGDATAAFQFGPLTLLSGSGGPVGQVSVFFNPAHDHVKGDMLGVLAQTPLCFQSANLADHQCSWMRRSAGLLTFSGFVPAPSLSTSSLVGVDDFDGDLRDEPVFRDTVSGVAYVGPSPISGAPALPLNWKLSATGDFNFDGKADILWRNSSSQKLVVWTMNGNNKIGNIIPSPDQAVNANWEVAAAADFNGDGNRDLLWYNQTTGKIVLWFMNASVARVTGQFTNPPSVGNNNWRVLAVGDYGKGPGGVYDTQDVVWQNDTSKKVVVWFMDLAGNRTGGTFTTPDSFFGGYDLVGPR